MIKAANINLQVKKTTKELFKLLDLDNVKVSIKSNKDEEEGIAINLEVEAQEAGMLIGFHGETIASLQLIIS